MRAARSIIRPASELPRARDPLTVQENQLLRHKLVEFEGRNKKLTAQNRALTDENGRLKKENEELNEKLSRLSDAYLMLHYQMEGMPTMAEILRNRALAQDLQNQLKLTQGHGATVMPNCQISIGTHLSVVSSRKG